MHLFGKLSYYFMQPCRYNQVLTGVLPYSVSNMTKMVTEIRAGKRPSRPIDPGQSQWLQRRVWGVITTGWSHKPEKRCELSVMHNAFVTSSQGGADSGDSNNQNNGNSTIAEISKTLKQGNNNLGNGSRGLPLSSSSCEIRSQKSRGVLMK